MVFVDLAEGGSSVELCGAARNRGGLFVSEPLLPPLLRFFKLGFLHQWCDYSQSHDRTVDSEALLGVRNKIMFTLVRGTEKALESRSGFHEKMPLFLLSTHC